MSQNCGKLDMKAKDREEIVMMTTGKSSLESIPLDLTIEILQRLPAKALLKFICISKTWYSVIRSQPFIDTFMSMSMSRPCLLFAFKINHGDDNQLLFFSSPHLSHESNVTTSSIVAKHEMTISKTYPVGDYIIHSESIRGFICCSHHRLFMVCNPTTRQVINLPEDHIFNPDNMKCYMHLGYDPSNDQYKVLRVITRPWSNFVSEHSVYTLGCRQSSSFPWRRVKSGISNYIPSTPWRRVKSGISNYIPSTNGVYINGVVYYEARIKPWNSMIVASFDFCSERLGQIKTPRETLSYLVKYQGKLAGLSFLGNNFSLWVLDDAKKQIWSKTFAFSHSFWGLRLTFSGTTDDGELVFAPYSFSDDFNVYYFDINRKKMRRVKLEGVTNHDEFRCRSKHFCYLSMACGHVDNITSIKLY